MGIVGAVLGKTRVQLIKRDKTVITFDCSLKENHSRESPATEFPIEDGSSISDDILLKPKKLELTGVISDTPLGIASAIMTSSVSAVVGNVGVISGAAGLALFNAISGSKSPSVQAFARMLQLQEEREPLDVITTLSRYSNMWIESITVPRDAQTGYSIEFTISLRELIIVQPKSVTINIFKDPNVAAGQADEGLQQHGPDLGEQFRLGQKTLRDITGGLAK